ncbi:hypothetical protein B0H34DRAFT_279175 [Crassisporium funariophilum]|nr:hypothetical protein B0H34DRAFT_279175 [Crassisporium funariophilum]
MACNHGHSSYPELNHTAGAKWIKNLTKDRLGTFNGGHYSDLNLSSVLFTHRLDNAEHVKLRVWSAPGQTKPTFEEAMQQKFKTAKKGDSFGPSWVSKIRVQHALVQTDLAHMSVQVKLAQSRCCAYAGPGCCPHTLKSCRPKQHC